MRGMGEIMARFPGRLSALIRPQIRRLAAVATGNVRYLHARADARALHLRLEVFLVNAAVQTVDIVRNTGVPDARCYS